MNRPRCWCDFRRRMACVRGDDELMIILGAGGAESAGIGLSRPTAGEQRQYNKNG